MPFDKRVRETWTTWTTIRKGKYVPRRIPYLAGLRNTVLAPLYELQQAGEKFDKILFLNDVVFDVSRPCSAVSLSTDQSRPTMFEDYFPPTTNTMQPPARLISRKLLPFTTPFATRDFDGYELLMPNWPFFRSKTSRDAARRNQPIPVTSCWDGMLIMDAAPFYYQNTRLGFRALPDELSAKHLEASECCLIHTDNPLSQSKGVFINPNVRVAYRGRTYDEVNPKRSNVWLSTLALARGPWENLIRRWLTSSTVTDRRLSKRLVEWQQEHPDQEESGRVCLVDETQILLFNGWIHI